MFDLDDTRKMLPSPPPPHPGLVGSVFQAQIYMFTFSPKLTGICHESLCMTSDQELDNSHTNSNLKKEIRNEKL